MFQPRRVLPEDEPVGLKHVRGSYSECNNTRCAFVFFYVSHFINLT
jgi:hypothetical protein